MVRRPFHQISNPNCFDKREHVPNPCVRASLRSELVGSGGGGAKGRSFTSRNNQFSVMTRFGKLMSTETMLRLYKAFILPHFYYCSMVWHFSSKQDSDKLDLLNKRILRFIFKGFNSEYNNLLKKAGMPAGM